MKKKLILKVIFFYLVSISNFNIFGSSVSSVSLVNTLDLAREISLANQSLNLKTVNSALDLSREISLVNQALDLKAVPSALELAREITINQDFINSISKVSSFQKTYKISPTNMIKKQALLPDALSFFSFNINNSKSTLTSPGSNGSYVFIQDPWNKVSTEFAGGKGVAVTIPADVQQNLFENFSNDQIYLSIIAIDKNGNYISDLTKEMPEYFYLYLFGEGYNGSLLTQEPIPFSAKNAVGTNSVSFTSNQFTMSGFGLSNLTLNYPFIVNIQNRLVYASQPASFDLKSTELSSLAFDISNGSSSYALSFIQAAAGSSLASDLNFIPTLTENFVLAVYGYDSLNNVLYTLSDLENSIQAGKLQGFIVTAHNEDKIPLANPVKLPADVNTNLKNIFTSGSLNIGLNVNGGSVTPQGTITYPIVIDIKNVENWGSVIYDLGNQPLSQLSLNFGQLAHEFIDVSDSKNYSFISALKRLPTSTQEFTLMLYGYQTTTNNNTTTSSLLYTFADLQAAIKSNTLEGFYYYVYDSNNKQIGNAIPLPSGLVYQTKTTFMQNNINIGLTVNNISNNEERFNYPVMLTIKNISDWSGSQSIDEIDTTKMTLQKNINLNYSINTYQGELQLTLQDGTVQSGNITPIAVKTVNGQSQQQPIQPANYLVITKSENIQINSKYSSITLKPGATIKKVFYSSYSAQLSISSLIAPLNSVISTLQDDQYIVITIDQNANLNMYVSASSASTNPSPTNSSSAQTTSSIASVNYDVQNKALTDFSFTVTNGSSSSVLPFIFSSNPVISDLSFLSAGLPKFTVQLYGYSADASGSQILTTLSDLQGAVKAKRTIKFLVDILDSTQTQIGSSIPVADDIASQLQNILGTGTPTVSLTVNSAQAATSSAITYPISVTLENISNFRLPIFDLENEELEDLIITISNGSSTVNLSCVQPVDQTTFISPLNFISSGTTDFSLKIYGYTSQGFLRTITDFLSSFENVTYKGLALYPFDTEDSQIADGVELSGFVPVELNRILRTNSFTLLAQVGNKVLNVITGASYPVKLMFKNISNWGNRSYNLMNTPLIQIDFNTSSGTNILSLTPADLTIIPAGTSRFKLELYGYDASNNSLKTFKELSKAISNKTLSGFALDVYGPQFQSLGTVSLSLSSDQVTALGAALISQTDYITLSVNGQKDVVTSGFTYPLFIMFDNIKGWTPPAKSTTSINSVSSVNVSSLMYINKDKFASKLGITSAPTTLSGAGLDSDGTMPMFNMDFPGKNGSIIYFFVENTQQQSAGSNFATQSVTSDLWQQIAGKIESGGYISLVALDANNNYIATPWSTIPTNFALFIFDNNGNQVNGIIDSNNRDIMPIIFPASYYYGNISQQAALFKEVSQQNPIQISGFNLPTQAGSFGVSSSTSVNVSNYPFIAQFGPKTSTSSSEPTNRTNPLAPAGGNIGFGRTGSGW